MRKNVILTVVGVLCVFAIPVCVHAEEEAAKPELPSANYINEPVYYQPSVASAVPAYQPPIASTPCCVLPSSTTVFPVPVPEFAKVIQTMQTQLVMTYFKTYGEAYESYIMAEQGLLTGEVDVPTFSQVKLNYLNHAIRFYREIAPPRAVALLEERVETAELYVSLLEEELENAKDDDMRASFEKLLVSARYIHSNAKKEREKHFSFPLAPNMPADAKEVFNIHISPQRVPTPVPNVR